MVSDKHDDGAPRFRRCGTMQSTAGSVQTAESVEDCAAAGSGVSNGVVAGD